MPIPVTVLYGTLLALVTLALAANVSLRRLSSGALLGAKQPDSLHRPIRAHGNSAEWLAATVLPLAFLELQGASWGALHVLGGGLLLARVCHAAFMLAGTRLTVWSATVLYGFAFVTAGWALWLRLS
jgi:uncharacterized protein